MPHALEHAIVAKIPQLISSSHITIPLQFSSHFLTI
jgi:hypothetical protein